MNRSIAARTARSALAADDDEILAHDSFGTGPEKVLVLHSWVGDARSFDAIKPYLDAATYTYVFADLRGYGRSRHLTGDYTAQEVAADAIRLAGHLGWERFHLVGHSMSGLVVQRMILDDWDRPERRIKSAVAITPVTADGFPADAPTRQFLWDMIRQDDLARQGLAAMTGQRLLASWSEVMMRRNRDTAAADAMGGYYRMWMDTDFSREAAAKRPATPLRVIGGRQDLPGFGEEKYRQTFSAWFPGVDLQFITDAGHFPMYETPVYLATLVESHLNAHQNRRTGGSYGAPV